MPVPVVSIRMRRIMDYLRKRGALGPERAIPKEEIPCEESPDFERLADNMVVRKRGGLCWLDEDTAASFRATRIRRVLVVVALCVLLVVLGLVSRRLGTR